MPYSAREKINENARRLFNDACLLKDNGRFPSAIALAILAIEEVGKRHLYDLKHRDENLLKNKRFPPRHIDKQAAFAAPFVDLVQRQAMIEAAKHFGAADWDRVRGTDDWEKTQDFLVEGYAVSQYDEEPGRRARALEILNEISAFVDARVDNHPLACLMGLANEGELDKEKQAAFYLDVSNDGAIKSDPSNLDKRNAEFWLDIASVAIKSLESLADAERAAHHFCDQYFTVPGKKEATPPATADDWRTMWESLNNQSLDIAKK